MNRIRLFVVRYKWLLLLIFVASVLRFWKLGKVPISIDWDEAALGYNAYSILKTGRDEYGTWFPLVLRSFDDYKPPLYAYLTIPSVLVFGLTQWSVRLPSAIMGVLAVIGVYFLVQELLGSKRPLSILAAFLLAISPWHIQFSRIAFEANIATTLNIWMVTFFLRGIRSGKFLIASAILAGLSLYAYHSERIFVPLLLLILTIIFHRPLIRQKSYVVISCFLGLLMVLPLAVVLTNPSTWMRLRGTSALSDEVRLLSRSVRKLEEDKLMGNIWGQVFDNRRVVWAQTVLDGYLAHFSFRWLFLTGDNDRHHAPDMGLLYIWELPFLLWGIYEVKRHGGTLSKILFSWFLISPIPASVTSEVPHAIRSMVFLPTFQLFTGIGLLQFYSLMRSHKRAFVVGITATGLIVLFNLLYYFNLYFVHMNREFSRFWQYGYSQAVEYVVANRSKYTKVIVSPKLEQPHMFFLFYLSYDPRRYLKEGGTRSGGFKEEKNAFDIFEFRPIQWDSEVHDGKTLYIGTPLEISGVPIRTIRYLDSSESIKIAE